MNKRTLLPLFLFLFVILSVPAFAYYDIEPFGDSQVAQINPTTNYGSHLGLAVAGSNSPQYAYYSFLAFNLSSVPFTEEIIGAELFLNVMSGINESLNSSVYNTTYFYENNITWNNKPLNDTYQDFSNVNASVYDYVNFTITNAVIHTRANNETLYLMVKPFNESIEFLGSYWARESGIRVPYIRIMTASGSGCNAPDEYVIGSACLDENTYYTNDGCNYTTTDCPTGSYCVQLTPQINATSDLYENYTSCQITTYLGTKINCWNICFWGSVVWSNCVDEGCKVCPDERGGIRYGSTYGYFTDTYYTNQSSVSVPSYTIACGYPNGTIADIIDETGSSTTIEDILTRAGNTITEVSPSGEILQPEDEGINGLKEWINGSMGTIYGSDIISLLLSGICAIALFLKTKDSEHTPTLFFGTFMLVASVCSFIGLLTMWFLVLEVSVIGVMIFWKAKGG